MAAQITLPDPGQRMTPGRKALILEAVRRGMITAAEACTRFDLSIEELTGWLERDAAHGRDGLSVTKLQEVGRRG